MKPYEWVTGTNTHRMTGFTNSATYRIIGQTDDSLEIRTASDFMPDDIAILHFGASDVYWVNLNDVKQSSSAREYFKRLNTSTPGKRKQ